MYRNVIYLYQEVIYMKNNIKILRTIKGIKQEDLAVLCGVRRETIIRIEKGSYNFSIELAVKICDALDCKLDDLIKEIHI